MAAHAKSSTSHPSSPGYSSQNSFQSKARSAAGQRGDSARGLSSRPMKKSYRRHPVAPCGASPDRGRRRRKEAA